MITNQLNFYTSTTNVLKIPRIWYEHHFLLYKFNTGIKYLSNGRVDISCLQKQNLSRVL